MITKPSNRRGVILVVAGLLVALSLVAVLAAPKPDTAGYSFAALPTPTGESAAAVFGQRCSTCHGDRGQGLTAEWRATWPQDHQNCSQSKCHGRNHPDDGFLMLNNYAPAIIGPAALNRFANAAALHAYVAAAMPWSAPGSMPADQYWKISNLLLWANGFIDVPYGVDDTNAAAITLDRRRFAIPTTIPVTPGVLPIEDMVAGGKMSATPHASP